MKCFAFFWFLLYLVHTKCYYMDTQSNPYYGNYYTSSYYNPNTGYNYNQAPRQNTEKVNIQVFYETFCPPCRQFDTHQLREVIDKLSPHLNINTYPYGNAKTILKDGKVDFECQHGPGECYGNKLHACALNIIRNHTQALLYNACMMEKYHSGRGSDDGAADQCGAYMSINSQPIKQCAKRDKGTQLLQYYGEITKKANIKSVPTIFINGVKNKGDNFMRDVCAAFRNPPAVCANVI